jgi:hypothetical protein
MRHWLLTLGTPKSKRNGDLEHSACAIAIVEKKAAEANKN